MWATSNAMLAMLARVRDVRLRESRIAIDVARRALRPRPSGVKTPLHGVRCVCTNCRAEALRAGAGRTSARPKRSLFAVAR
jgi:hypothetical protein